MDKWQRDIKLELGCDNQLTAVPSVRWKVEELGCDNMVVLRANRGNAES